jgi:hypothetical protein
VIAFAGAVPFDHLIRSAQGLEALQKLRKIMSKLKLTVNEEKTRICKVPEGEFDFSGLQCDIERRASYRVTPRLYTFETCLPAQNLSAYRGRPEVTVGRSERRE